MLTLMKLALATTRKYNISVLTRDPTSPASVSLVSNYNVKLIPGSYTSELGLRAAFVNQAICYFNIDSFSTGEPYEYFWTFRAYEIAIQSGLKWFIYAGAPDGFSRVGFEEKYRNSHNVVAWRLSSWFASQPLARLKWTIVTGGIYAEMLGSLLRPMKDEKTGEFTFIAPVGIDSVLPLLPLEMYGARVLWAIRNPEKSIGRYLTSNPFQVTYPQIVEAVSKVTGLGTSFQPISVDAWMEGIKPFIDPESTLPRGSTEDDPTAFTFRKSFGAWWAIWNDNRHREDIVDDHWADEVMSDRAKTLEDWLRKVNYDGGPARSI